MFIKACEEWNINPCESIMVGDMKTDETAAKRIGIKYIDVKKFWQ
jgi:FMN phosphatase YigB (HAD superfamily)